MDLAKMLGSLAKLQDMQPYADRKIGRWDSEDGKRCVSTCTVTDGVVEYETAIAHPEFNDGQLVIVGKYETREEAVVGHDEWVKVINDLPDELLDVDNSGLLGGPRTFKRGEGFPSKEGD